MLLPARPLFSLPPRMRIFWSSRSIALGFHHYVIFLVRNFNDLSLPCWHEEGPAGCLARVRVNSDEVEFERFSRAGNKMLANVSELFSMDRLLYSDAALASQRPSSDPHLANSASL